MHGQNANVDIKCAPSLKNLPTLCLLYNARAYNLLPPGPPPPPMKILDPPLRTSIERYFKKAIFHFICTFLLYTVRLEDGHVTVEITEMDDEEIDSVNMYPVCGDGWNDESDQANWVCNNIDQYRDTGFKGTAQVVPNILFGSSNYFRFHRNIDNCHINGKFQIHFGFLYFGYFPNPSELSSQFKPDHCYFDWHSSGGGGLRNQFPPPPPRPHNLL